MNIPDDDRPEPPPIPPYIQDGKPLIRGTAAWDERERIRKQHGKRLLSFGPIADPFFLRGSSYRK